MSQLHCYVPDEVAEKLKRRAAEAQMPVSRYLARLVRRDVEGAWPEGYFESFGAWQGEPLERAGQGEFEQRDGFA